MIETLTVPLDEFDLAGFIQAYREFYLDWSKSHDDPDLSIPVMESFDSVPENLYTDRDLVEELAERKWRLFFQMHEPLAADQSLCIDGERREVGDFDIGVADGYGFLVEIHDGQISLHPALYDGSSGPVPRIHLQGQCSVMDDCMAKFASRFVRKVD